MIFLNILGLLALIGIPILIIIYIIKSKYEDHKVSSTYIWKLSRKFQKKRLPRRFREMILFILQLLMIAAAAFMLARPAIMEQGVVEEHIIVVDASASMQAQADGMSRFDRALSMVHETAKTMFEGSTISVIIADDEPECYIEKMSSASEIRATMNTAQCGYGGCNMEKAMELAQSMYDANPLAQVTVYSDKEFAFAENVTVHNMAKQEWNAAVLSVDAFAQGGKIVVTGDVVCYGKSTGIIFTLEINGRVSDAQLVELEDSVSTQVEWNVSVDEAVSTVKVSFDEADAIAADNSYTLFREAADPNKVLLVSEYPLFLQKLFEAMDDCELTVASGISAEQMSGFDVYVFDGKTPDSFPTDGAIWVINPDEKFNQRGMEISDAIKGSYMTVADDNGTEDFAKLTNGLKFDKIAASKFRQVVKKGGFDVILKCGELPALLASNDKQDNKMLVMMFDLHDTNLAMHGEFILLVRNMMSFSLPKMIDKRTYNVGEQVTVTMLPKSRQLVTVLPDGTESSPVPEDGKHTMKLEKCGAYTLMQSFDEGETKTIAFYASIPSSESNIFGAEDGIKIRTDSVSTQVQTEETELEIWKLFAIVLLLLMLAEWVVYYRSQF